MASDTLILELFTIFREQPGTIYLDGEWGLFAAEPTNIWLDKWVDNSDKLIAGYYSYEMNQWSEKQGPLEKAFVCQYDWYFKRINGKWEYFGDKKKLNNLQKMVDDNAFKLNNECFEENNKMVTHRTPKSQYLNNIALIKEDILNGEYFQANYTIGFELNYAPSSIEYLNLQSSPYGGFLRTSKGSIWSRSPECFIKCKAGIVETHPIKGTSARSSNIEQDALNMQQLINSEKDKQENIMIVDLMRNDLSKACVANSINVEALCEAKSYQYVHHLVSKVTGRLSVSPLECLYKCFPPGSVTGAPKKRAVERMMELEGEPRGAYCGTMFYAEGDELVSNVLIRTMTVVNTKSYYNAGGAITLNSEPEDEYNEVLDKAAAFTKVFV